jgi:hypothetical protein
VKTGRPYERSDLVETIQSGGTLAGVAQRILRREPDGQLAWAANRILLLDPDFPGPLDVALLVHQWYMEQKGHDVSASLASHALGEDLMRVLGDPAAFLNARQQRLEGVVRGFLEVMAETQLEDTPPLDSFDLDDLEEARDDALA